MNSKNVSDQPIRCRCLMTTTNQLRYLHGLLSLYATEQTSKREWIIAAQANRVAEWVKEDLDKRLK